MQTVIRGKVCLFLAVTALLMIGQGCAGKSPGQPDPTLAALSTAVSGTATAAKGKAGSVDTRATAQAEATATGETVQATQTARAANRSEEELAEATIAAPIVAELPQYGLDTQGGHTGWVHDPFTLDITGAEEFAYKNDHMEVTAADFALAADIAWDTQYGSSGCGFMFRSNGDQKKPSQYLVIATRFAGGHVIFTALAEGEIANVHEFYPKDEDRSFQWQNGTTNRLAVIARGNLIEIYTNGVKIGEVDTTQPPGVLPAPPKPQLPKDPKDLGQLNAYKAQIAEYEDILQQSQISYQTAVKNYMKRQAVYTDGFLAMIAATDSGRTACTFEDAWLWLIEP